MNILLVTLDQFRGDALSCAGHPAARTPNLDALAADGVRFARHFSQAAPCGPGRASLYTGLYQMTHRVVANGTPLDARFDNVARVAARAGYAPALFGYTDQAFDPRAADGPDDPRLQSYEEVLPGFVDGLHMPADNPRPWLDWLAAKGFPQESMVGAYRSEPQRDAALSCSAFLTGKAIDWIEAQGEPWFAHVSLLRPHPPYWAAGEYSTMFGSAEAGEPSPPWPDDLHPLYARLRGNRHTAAPADPALMARVRAQYFGMIAEVDAQLGRLFAALKTRGAWEDTFIVVTSDHGEQLGDHGLIGKGGFFEESYAIPCIVRDPRAGRARGAVVEAFTEAVDVLPTLAEAMGLAAPDPCDGAALTPFLNGDTPNAWREAAHCEFDWRESFLRGGETGAALERHSLAVRRSQDAAYVQFADGSSLAFDLAADPGWRTTLTDPARLLAEAQAMLAWRAQHAERTLTGTLIDHGVKGRAPPAAPEMRRFPVGA